MKIDYKIIKQKPLIMSKIKIDCIETMRTNAKKVWFDSGKENFLIFHNEQEVCLELTRKKKFRVNKEGEEIPISDHRRRETFAKVANIFLNDNIPIYRQTT